MKLSFHGADRTVTGSCHLLQVNDLNILVDCGLFQGDQTVENANTAGFGFDPAAIDYVLLTHAHLDHCGRLPLLVKRGFKGAIITTAATRDLCRLVLLDSAHLQEEEARYKNKLAQRHGDRPAAGPLYGLMDVFDTLDRFGANVEYDRPYRLHPGLVATFVDAGHILGSASVLLEVTEGDTTKRILFSGDLGNSGRPLMRAPVTVSDVDIVVMESTYGDRQHRPFGASVEEFYEAVNESVHRGGNIIIPTFALERAQELLVCLHSGIDENKISPALHVFLDSPMAISATEIFRRHPEAYSSNVAALFTNGDDPFQLPGLQFTRETADSIALNRIRGGALIMAGSGMCTGGRVRHHLRHNLGRADSSVIFVGFAASGTLARLIIDGAREVRIFGEPIRVQARVYTINGFSAHADQKELVAWHEKTAARQTFLTHGEPMAMEALRAKLRGGDAIIPEQGDSFEC